MSTFKSINHEFKSWPCSLTIQKKYNRAIILGNNRNTSNLEYNCSSGFHYQIKHYAIEGAVGQTPNQMDGVIKTRHEGGEPSEDFVMLSSDLIMPVYSYICGMCK